MNVVTHSGRSVVIALVLGCASAMSACSGNETNPPAATGGSSGSGGNLTGGSGGVRDGGSGGGIAGQDGSTGGAAGTGGVLTEAGDARTDVAAGGAGGSTGSDASDVVIPNDDIDAPVVSDVTDADEASEGDLDHVCPEVPGGRRVLASFSLVEGSTPDILGWSTYGVPAVTSSSEDFAGPNAAPFGSLHAQLTFPFGGYGSKQVIEKGFFPPNNPGIPQDYSCFTRMHIWIKVLSPASSFLSVQPYVIHNDAPNTPFDGAFGMYYDGANLETLADGNWHEMVTTMSGTTSAITKYGVEVHPFATAPADAGLGPDGAAPVPPPVEVLLDNIWLE